VKETQLPDTTPQAAPAAHSPEGMKEVTGCWGSYGVYGDGSCQELRNFIHCRNCPVYSSAGTRLIDRPLPPDYRRDWTLHFAKEKRFTETESASVILFRVNGEWLGMPTHSLQEVAEKRAIHSLPHHRAGMLLGVANVRGELVLCVSIGHVLQMERLPRLSAIRRNYHRLLVMQWESNRFGFPVEAVHGPQRFHPEELQPPAAVTGVTVPGTQALVPWQGTTARLLEPQSLISAVHHVLA